MRLSSKLLFSTLFNSLDLIYKKPNSIERYGQQKLKGQNNSNQAVRLDGFGSDSSRHLEFINSKCVLLTVAKIAWSVSSEGRLMSLFKTDVKKAAAVLGSSHPCHHIHLQPEGLAELLSCCSH